jgi:hypothetical protein
MSLREAGLERNGTVIAGKRRFQPLEVGAARDPGVAPGPEAYLRMWERYTSGLPPSSFCVAENPAAGHV